MQCNQIADVVNKCEICELSKTRTNAVSGEGASDADIIFIGEAPGRTEDLQGRPFVGRAGKLLNELLVSIGLQRENVFITNIVKCRPPKNRNPKTREIQSCTPYLNAQIACIDPTILIPLGSFAVRFLFEHYKIPLDSIGKIHGQIFTVNQDNKTILLQPMYHPAAAIYNPNLRETLFHDFQQLLKALELKNTKP